MYYAIDHDTRRVLCKSPTDELHTYVEENGLALAITVVDSEDDLSLNFTIEEIDSVLGTLGQKPRKWEDEDDAAEFCWSTMEDSDVQLFSKRSAKKLLGSDSSADVEPAPSKTGKPTSTKTAKAPRTSKGVRAKDLIGMTFCAGSNTPRKGTSFEIFTQYLEENLDEATFDELVGTFIDNYVPKNPDKPVDEPLGKAYVRDAFNGGFIEEAL